jgi:phosphatidate cytidylyltransferase
MTFLKRLISTVLLISAVAYIIFTLPNWIYSSAVAVLVGFGLYEFYSLVNRKGTFVYKYFGMILGVIVPILIHLMAGGFMIDLEPFYIVIACLFIIIIQFIRKTNHDALSAISVTLFGILYISWFFSFLIKLKFLPQGSFLVAFIIAVTKSGDIGAYIVGSTIGKHPLIPRISPKKSLEGMIGGLCFSILGALACRRIMPSFSIEHLVALGLLLGVVGQIGDLSESLIKRDCGAKDSGKSLPGLGGVLDLIDSLLFTVPIFYFYLKVFNL